MARFGANIIDAHSCFVLIPSSIVKQFSDTVRLGSPTISNSYRADVLELGGYHSLSNELLPGALISRETGLIGWVAKHARGIHVSPFEHDSRTLGVYSADQHLKSFIGVPILFGDSGSDESCCGVLACDSKKAFAFSKLQGKLLDDLALEVSRLVSLSIGQLQGAGQGESWESFIQRAYQLGEALGMNSIEVLRLKLSNFAEIERSAGSAQAIEIVQQVERLIQQALPPHFPMLKLPNGDLVMLVDNMMTSFYETKINAVCGHVAVGKLRLRFEFSRRSWKDKGSKAVPIETMIAETAGAAPLIELHSELMYEHRRA